MDINLQERGEYFWANKDDLKRLMLRGGLIPVYSLTREIAEALSKEYHFLVQIVSSRGLREVRRRPDIGLRYLEGRLVPKNYEVIKNKSPDRLAR